MTQKGVTRNVRGEVARRSRGLCAYCRAQETVVGMRFTVDHVIPRLLGGTDDLSNLCWACWDCNLIKLGRIAALDPLTGEQVPLFHPNHQAWEDHFGWVESGRFAVGRTAVGRATVVLLRLNRAVLVQARERWIEAGWHPPET